MIIDNKPVLLILPDFADDPEYTIGQQRTVVALSPAPRLVAYTGKRPAIGFPVKFAFRKRAEIRAFEAFFYGRAGKHGGFWIPSWDAELAPTAGISNTGTELSISPVNYATVYDPTTVDTRAPGHYIFLYDISGAVHVSAVSSVTGTSPEVLTLATPVTRDWVLGKFFVGFVYFVRFAVDTLALDYRGRSAATCELGVMEDIRINNGPEIEIIDPTDADTYTTAFALDLGGRAYSPAGVDEVTWENDRGGDGTADGTTAWTISEISLSTGINVITVTVTDLDGNSASDILTVTKT